jgi:hypothetical protein
VPFDQRPVYLERVAMKLRGQDIGDGLVHRVVYRDRAFDRVGRRAVTSEVPLS